MLFKIGPPFHYVTMINILLLHKTIFFPFPNEKFSWNHTKPYDYLNESKIISVKIYLDNFEFITNRKLLLTNDANIGFYFLLIVHKDMWISKLTDAKSKCHLVRTDPCLSNVAPETFPVKEQSPKTRRRIRMLKNHKKKSMSMDTLFTCSEWMMMLFVIFIEVQVDCVHNQSLSTILGETIIKLKRTIFRAKSLFKKFF